MEEELRPNGTQFEGKEEYVKEVFTEIASYYDEMNELMSMGMIKRWHRFMMKKAGDIDSKICLDIGTGTGEIAFLLAKNVGKDGKVYGVDITPRMLEYADMKMKEQDIPRPIIFEVGDALSLRFQDGYFDVVTSGYMLRNVTDIQKAINEMFRVLKPGGRAVVAELSKPNNRFIRFFYNLYMNHRVYWLGKKYGGGKKINGKEPAYEWLTSSIEGFPHGKEMTDKFKKAGFEDAQYFVKSLGAVNIYLGIKK